MTKRYDAHQQRQMELSLFGKNLTRRSKAKCELTGDSGVPLHIYEIPPVPSIPDIDRCLMLSEAVIDQLNTPTSITPDHWRHLRELIWSEIPTVQIMSYRILTHIAKDHLWAQEILAEAYLDEDIITSATTTTL